ncbi:SpoIIE family protein phosphatase, partial [Ilyobacter sp.]|uniref:SpoIIE family protein phosphatase n=1 Tax=Ilyobacter sp. TaxID=3100343 RepID=UPI00356722E3
MTEYFIDVSHKNINKFGEELCGDNVETVKTDDGVILVLSDGLGSGVKANILATLTSKIAVTMLKEGASIEETIDTITNTLPECSVRKLAYSTFTIIKIKNNGETYMVEYDNPPCFFFRKGCDYPLDKIERIVNGKKIHESHFKMTTEDLLVVTSDGALHAGVGELLNLGWQWNDINEFLRSLSGKNYFSSEVSENLLAVCNKLYDNKPGDDTTVLSVKLQYRKYLDLFTGPPAKPEDDVILLDKIKEAKGIKILSGGTTSNIVSKAFGEEVFINLTDYQKYDVPPVGFMRGVDLVTE